MEFGVGDNVVERVLDLETNESPTPGVCSFR
jgi:hypothetical protein